MYKWEVTFKDENNNDYIYDYWNNAIYHSGECFQNVRKLKGQYDIDTIVSLLPDFSREEVLLNYKRIQKIEETNKLITKFKTEALEKPKKYLPRLTHKTFEKMISLTKQLTLEVCQSCNQRCEYCIYSGKYEFQRTHPEGNKVMSFDIARKSIDYFISLINSKKRILKYGNAAIGFYGGEPLLAFELIKECVDYIKKKETKEKIIYTITTNGTRLNEEMINFFIQNDFWILLSLDGPQEEHDKFRVFKNKRGTFEKTMKGISMLKKYQDYYEKKVSISSTYCMAHDLLSIEEFFEENFKDKNILASAIRSTRTDFYRKVKPDPNFLEKYKRLFRKYCDAVENNKPLSSYINGFFSKNLAKVHDRPMIRLDNRLNGILKIFNICANCFPGEKIFVDTDGVFFICERVNQFFSIGDYQNGINFKKVKKIVESYSQFALKHCLFCEARRFCNLCISHNGVKGNFEYNDTCENARMILRDTLGAYITLYQRNKNALLNNLRKVS
ncbi:MAG: radical SAM protein [Candidatus Omnitrophota bacterium]